MKYVTIAAFAVLLSAGSALAQPKADPCKPQERATIGAGQELAAKDDKPLSDKLARTDGVICPPPAVDPDIKAPTPPGGRIQVIPPPGAPGGDQSVRPK